jgi:serine/threonine protein kinase
VLLAKGYEPKISDFGLSRMLVSNDVQTTSSNVGPLKHMAPECLLHSQYSAKSDVWAFAIVLIEIYTRYMWKFLISSFELKKNYRDEPYPTLSPVAVATQVSQKVDALRPDAPKNMSEEMKSMFDECINTEPDKRPSFEEICDQLEKLTSFFK